MGLQMETEIGKAMFVRVAQQVFLFCKPRVNWQMMRWYPFYGATSLHNNVADYFPTIWLQVPMGTRIAVVLLWIATSVDCHVLRHGCHEITGQSTLLTRFRHCKVTIEDGHLNALCNILVVSPPLQEFIPADPEVLTMEQLLVSDKPVVNMTPEDGPACLSLRAVKLKKWDDFPQALAKNYDHFLTAEHRHFGPFSVYSMLIYIRQMTFSTTFNRGPPLAAAVPIGRLADGSCSFDIYGFVDRYHHNFSSKPDIPAFVKYWNLRFTMTEAANVTFTDTVKMIPIALFRIVALTPIKRVVFHKCNFERIGFNEIPRVKGLESLEFFQAPIKEVHPFAFDLSRDLKNISFVSTMLSGIPEAIFLLKQLDTLDMSDTDVPRNATFGFCPGKCPWNSTALRLIISGTNLTTLPNRAFCGFPMLKEVFLDRCRLTNIHGSPFECLEQLEVLSISRNDIKWLHGENLKGLKRLVYLNMNNNGITYLQGSHVLSNLISLRTLAVAQNEIDEVQFDSMNNFAIQELNLAGNQLRLWRPPLFIHMRKLKDLNLADNVLSRIDDDMRRDLYHINHVNVSYNPWDCSSCQLKNLRSILQMHPDMCNNCFLCAQPLEQYGKDVRYVTWPEDKCSPLDHYRTYGIPVILSFMSMTMLAYVLYRNRWYCMYGLLYLKVSIKGYRRQRHSDRFIWDGFLSYHTSDADLVRDVLIPRLESPPMHFRLCVAERDFIPGLPIVENICRAIALSRTSVFVLSREFCRSRWCMFELSLAHHRLSESDRHYGIVLIKKNDVDESEMGDVVEYYVKSRTYVQLPLDSPDDAQKGFFWLQLQAALEH
nr:toll-like receptor 2 [Dermacentor andersoni]